MLSLAGADASCSPDTPAATGRASTGTSPSSPTTGCRPRRSRASIPSRSSCCARADEPAVSAPRRPGRRSRCLSACPPGSGCSGVGSDHTDREIERSRCSRPSSRARRSRPRGVVAGRGRSPLGRTAALWRGRRRAAGYQRRRVEADPPPAEILEGRLRTIGAERPLVCSSGRSPCSTAPSASAVPLRRLLDPRAGPSELWLEVRDPSRSSPCVPEPSTCAGLRDAAPSSSTGSASPTSPRQPAFAGIDATVAELYDVAPGLARLQCDPPRPRRTINTVSTSSRARASTSAPAARRSRAGRSYERLRRPQPRPRRQVPGGASRRAGGLRRASRGHRRERPAAVRRVVEGGPLRLLRDHPAAGTRGTKPGGQRRGQAASRSPSSRNARTDRRVGRADARHRQRDLRRAVRELHQAAAAGGGGLRAVVRRPDRGRGAQALLPAARTRSASRAASTTRSRRASTSRTRCRLRRGLRARGRTCSCTARSRACATSSTRHRRTCSATRRPRSA